jgi:hypothetical protein
VSKVPIKCYIEMVKLILANDGDPHYTDEQISAPVVHASSPQMLEVLFNAGANDNDPHYADEQISAPVVHASSPQMLEVLFNVGANDNVAGAVGETLLDWVFCLPC